MGLRGCRGKHHVQAVPRELAGYCVPEEDDDDDDGGGGGDDDDDNEDTMNTNDDDADFK